MRLSDATVLGSLILRPVAGGDYTSDTEGCALQMAMAAVGVTGNRFYCNAAQHWPWLKQMNGGGMWLSQLRHKFDMDVMINKTMTFEELVAWIRSVEPPETHETNVSLEPSTVAETVSR